MSNPQFESEAARSEVRGIVDLLLEARAILWENDINFAILVFCGALPLGWELGKYGLKKWRDFQKRRSRIGRITGTTVSSFNRAARPRSGLFDAEFSARENETHPSVAGLPEDPAFPHSLHGEEIDYPLFREALLGLPPAIREQLIARFPDSWVVKDGSEYPLINEYLDKVEKAQGNAYKDALEMMRLLSGNGVVIPIELGTAETGTDDDVWHLLVSYVLHVLQNDPVPDVQAATGPRESRQGSRSEARAVQDDFDIYFTYSNENHFTVRQALDEALRPYGLTRDQLTGLNFVVFDKEGAYVSQGGGRYEEMDDVSRAYVTARTPAGTNIEIEIRPLSSVFESVQKTLLKVFSQRGLPSNALKQAEICSFDRSGSELAGPVLNQQWTDPIRRITVRSPKGDDKSQIRSEARLTRDKLRKFKAYPDRFVEGRLWVPTRSLSAPLESRRFGVKTFPVQVASVKRRTQKEILEFVRKNTPQVTGMQRFIDVGGSSIDLRALIKLLTKLGVNELDLLPSTTVVAGNFPLELKMGLAAAVPGFNTNDIIQYVIHYKKQEESRIIEKKKTYTVVRKGKTLYTLMEDGTLRPFLAEKEGAYEIWGEKGDKRIQKRKAGQVIDGQMGAFAYFMSQVGAFGVRGDFRTLQPIAEAGGLGRSGGSNAMFIAMAGILSGADLSKADIQAEAIEKEGNGEDGALAVLGGYTGGQESGATLQGGASQFIHLTEVKGIGGHYVWPVGTELVVPLAGSLEEVNRRMLSHVALVQPGLPFVNGDATIKRTAGGINTTWSTRAKEKGDTEGLELHASKTLVAMVAAYGVAHDRWDLVIWSQNEHRRLRNELDKGFYKAAIQALDRDPARPAYADKYLQILREDPILNKYLQWHIKGKDDQEKPFDLRNVSLYSMTQGPLIRAVTEIVREVTGQSALELTDLDSPAAVFIPGAGGTGSPAVIMAETPELLKRILERLRLPNAEGQPAKLRPFTPEDVLTTMGGTGLLQGYLQPAAGAAIEFKGLPDDTRSVREGIAGVYDQRTGIFYITEPQEGIPAEILDLPRIRILSQDKSISKAYKNQRESRGEAARSNSTERREVRTRQDSVAEARQVERQIKLSPENVQALNELRDAFLLPVAKMGKGTLIPFTESLYRGFHNAILGPFLLVELSKAKDFWVDQKFMEMLGAIAAELKRSAQLLEMLLNGPFEISPQFDEALKEAERKSHSGVPGELSLVIQNSDQRALLRGKYRSQAEKVRDLLAAAETTVEDVARDLSSRSEARGIDPQEVRGTVKGQAAHLWFDREMRLVIHMDAKAIEEQGFKGQELEAATENLGGALRRAYAFLTLGEKQALFGFQKANAIQHPTGKWIELPLPIRVESGMSESALVTPHEIILNAALLRAPLQVLALILSHGLRRSVNRFSPDAQSHDSAIFQTTLQLVSAKPELQRAWGTWSGPGKTGLFYGREWNSPIAHANPLAALEESWHEFLNDANAAKRMYRELVRAGTEAERIEAVTALMKRQSAPQPSRIFSETYRTNRGTKSRHFYVIYEMGDGLKKVIRFAPGVTRDWIATEDAAINYMLGNLRIDIVRDVQKVADEIGKERELYAKYPSILGLLDLINFGSADKRGKAIETLKHWSLEQKTETADRTKAATDILFAMAKTHPDYGTRIRLNRFVFDRKTERPPEFPYTTFNYSAFDTDGYTVRPEMDFRGLPPETRVRWSQNGSDIRDSGILRPVQVEKKKATYEWKVPVNQGWIHYAFQVKKEGEWRYVKSPMDFRKNEAKANGIIKFQEDVRGRRLVGIRPEVFNLQLEHMQPMVDAWGNIHLGTLEDLRRQLKLIRGKFDEIYIQALETGAPGEAGPDASPFSPMDQIHISARIGGMKGLMALKAEADKLGLQIAIDMIPHIARSNREASPRTTVWVEEPGSGRLVRRAGTDAISGDWLDSSLRNWADPRNLKDYIDQLSVLARLGFNFRIDVAHVFDTTFETKPELMGPARIYGYVITPSGNTFDLRSSWEPSTVLASIIYETKKAGFEKGHHTKFYGENWHGHEPRLLQAGVDFPFDPLVANFWSIIREGQWSQEFVDSMRWLADLHNLFGGGTVTVINNHDAQVPPVDAFGPAAFAATAAIIFANGGVNFQHLHFSYLNLDGSIDWIKVFAHHWRIYVNNYGPARIVNNVYWAGATGIWGGAIGATLHALSINQTLADLGNFQQRIHALITPSNSRAIPIDVGHGRVIGMARQVEGETLLGIFHMGSPYAADINFYPNDSKQWGMGIGEFDDDAVYKLEEIYDNQDLSVTKDHPGDKIFFTGREVNHLGLGPRFPLPILGVRVFRFVKAAGNVSDLNPDDYRMLLKDSIQRSRRYGPKDRATQGLISREILRALKGGLEDFTKLFGLLSDIVAQEADLEASDLSSIFADILFYYPEQQAKLHECLVDIAVLSRQSSPRASEDAVKVLRGAEVGEVVLSSAESLYSSGTGGLALYVTDIAKQLAALGINVTVVVPMFADHKAEIFRKFNPRETGRTITVAFDNGDHIQHNTAKIYAIRQEGVRVLYLENDERFTQLSGKSGYGKSAYEGDMGYRYRFARMLSLGTLLAVREMNIHPRIIHTGEWGTAYVKAYLEGYGREDLNDKNLRHDPHFAGTKVISVGHNLQNGYQGKMQESNQLFRDLTIIRDLGFKPEEWEVLLSKSDWSVNPTFTAIQTADHFVTVGGGYRERSLDMRHDGEFGGLVPVLQWKNSVGGYSAISNGFDLVGWQKRLFGKSFFEMGHEKERRRFFEELLATKLPENKKRLQKALGLKEDTKEFKTFLVMMMHRIDWQKGHQLLLADVWDAKNPDILKSAGGLFEKMDDHVVPLTDQERKKLERFAGQYGRGTLRAIEVFLLLHPDAQFAVVGPTSDSFFNDGFNGVASNFSDQFRFRPEFMPKGNPLYELFYSGATVFDMPSLFEPGGLGNKEAGGAGAVRHMTNRDGLKDAVIVLEKGEGDKKRVVSEGFEPFNPVVWLTSLRELHRTFKEDKELWNELRYQVITQDWRWLGLVKDKYLPLYMKTAGQRDDLELHALEVAAAIHRALIQRHPDPADELMEAGFTVKDAVQQVIQTLKDSENSVLANYLIEVQIPHLAKVDSKTRAQLGIALEAILADQAQSAHHERFHRALDTLKDPVQSGRSEVRGATTSTEKEVLSAEIEQVTVTPKGTDARSEVRGKQTPPSRFSTGKAAHRLKPIAKFIEGVSGLLSAISQRGGAAKKWVLAAVVISLPFVIPFAIGYGVLKFFQKRFRERGAVEDDGFAKAFVDELIENSRQARKNFEAEQIDLGADIERFVFSRMKVERLAPVQIAAVKAELDGRLQRLLTGMAQARANGNLLSPTEQTVLNARLGEIEDASNDFEAALTSRSEVRDESDHRPQTAVDRKPKHTPEVSSGSVDGGPLTVDSGNAGRSEMRNDQAKQRLVSAIEREMKELEALLKINSTQVEGQILELQKWIAYSQQELLVLGGIGREEELPAILAMAPLQRVYEVYRAANKVASPAKGVTSQDIFRFFYGAAPQEQEPSILKPMFRYYRDLLPQGKTLGSDRKFMLSQTMARARETFVHTYTLQLRFLEQMALWLTRREVLKMFDDKRLPAKGLAPVRTGAERTVPAKAGTREAKQLQAMLFAVFLKNLIMSKAPVAPEARALSFEAGAILAALRALPAETGRLLETVSPRSEARLEKLEFRVTPIRNSRGETTTSTIFLRDREDHTPIGRFSIPAKLGTGPLIYTINLSREIWQGQTAEFTVTLNDGVLESVGDMKVIPPTWPSNKQKEKERLEAVQGEMRAFLESKIGQPWSPKLFSAVSSPPVGGARSEVRSGKLRFIVGPPRRPLGFPPSYQIYIWDGEHDSFIGTFHILVTPGTGRKIHKIYFPYEIGGSGTAQFTVTLSDQGILMSVGDITVSRPSTAKSITATSSSEIVRDKMKAFLESKLGQRWGPDLFRTVSSSPAGKARSEVRSERQILGEMADEVPNFSIEWFRKELKGLTPEIARALKYWTPIFYTQRPLDVARAKDNRARWQGQQITHELPVAAQLLKKMALELSSGTLAEPDFTEVIETLRAAIKDGRSLQSAGRGSRGPKSYDQLEVLANSPDLLKIILNKLKTVYEAEKIQGTEDVPPSVPAPHRSELRLLNPEAILAPERITLIQYFYFNILPMQLRELIEAAGGREAVLEALRKIPGIIVSEAAVEIPETSVLDGWFAPEVPLAIPETAGKGLAVAKAATPTVTDLGGKVFLGQDLLARLVAENPRALFYLLKTYAVFTEQNEPPALLTSGSRQVLFKQIENALSNRGSGLVGVEIAECSALVQALKQGEILDVIEPAQGTNEAQVINELTAKTQGGIASLHLSAAMLPDFAGGVHFAFDEKNIGSRDLMVASVFAIVLKSVADANARAELLSKVFEENLPGVQMRKQGSNSFVITQITKLAQEFAARAYIATRA